MRDRKVIEEPRAELFLKIRTLLFLEKSVSDYPVTQRDIPD
jgi:hypothetical protein